MKTKRGSILIVDDDEDVLVTSRIILKDYFEHVRTLLHPTGLPSALRETQYDVVVLDMNFKAGVTNGNEGIYWMNEVRKLSPLSQVVLQTAYGDIGLAVKSIREGAIDFLPKPWDKAKLIEATLNAFQLCQTRNRHTRKAVVNDTPTTDSIVAVSPIMKEIMVQLNQIAPTDASVLLLGENGTGKELLARTIHNLSHRRLGPFVHVDLGAVPASLFESQLFGHLRGAFTDAKETMTGKFAQAQGGTLFLDELANLPLELQVKLLSALQTRTITPLGSHTPVHLDVRIICATNAPLREMVTASTFRQDLYFRINTIELTLPPLRERQEDIPELAAVYTMRYAEQYRKEVTITDDVVQVLKEYHWPGNIRQLQHSIERAVILAPDRQLRIEHFQLNDLRSTELFPAGETLNLNEVEKRVIRQAIQKHRENLSRAAQELGIGRSTLYRKMEDYGINI